MKKLITSAIAAAALLFGMMSCSGDLHDVDTSPFSATESVFLIGGIADSTADASQYKTKVTDPANGFEVALVDGKFSFEFTYSGKDSWSAGAGNHAFTIMSNVDGGWDGATARWGNGRISVGGSGTISLSGSNIVLTGLEAGTKYTLTGSLTAAGGTISLEKGLAGVAMDIINVKDGLMTDAFAATGKTTGDKYEYTYALSAEKDGSLSFVVRVGEKVWVPTAAADLTSGNATVASSTRFDNVTTVNYPITFNYEKWEYGYELSFSYDTIADSLTVEAVKLSGMYIASNISGGAWAAMTPEKDDAGNVTGWSILGTGTQLTPGWDPVYGINTERAYNDDTYRALKDDSTVIAELGKSVGMSKQSKRGDSGKNVKITASLDAAKTYKLTFVVTDADAGSATIMLTESE